MKSRVGGVGRVRLAACRPWRDLRPGGSSSRRRPHWQTQFEDRSTPNGNRSRPDSELEMPSMGVRPGLRMHLMREVRERLFQISQSFARRPGGGSPASPTFRGTVPTHTSPISQPGSRTHLMISSSVKNKNAPGQMGRCDDNDDAMAKNTYMSPAGAIEPATAEM